MNLIHDYVKNTVHTAGMKTFREMKEVHNELGGVASEFMNLNQEYVLNHLEISDDSPLFDPHGTQTARDILETGFTKNQIRLLNRLKEGIFITMPDCYDIPPPPAPPHHTALITLAFLVGIVAGAAMAVVMI